MSVISASILSVVGPARGLVCSEGGFVTSVRIPCVQFESIYEHGFARVAACTSPIAVADPAANAEAILRQARACAEEGVAVAVFPELCLSGYSIEDLLLQDALLDGVEAALADGRRRARRTCCTVLAVGAPLRHRDRVYNCAVVVHRGRVLGVAPKSYLPDLPRVLRAAARSRAGDDAARRRSRRR